jgi:hypothetical protein
MFASTTGNLVDRITQRWVQFTGRPIDVSGEHKWLDGPTGEPEGIGSGYFTEFARKHGLQIMPGAGLLDDFQVLRSSYFDPGRVSKPVADFYERTADYSLDAWSEWCNVFRPFGTLLAMIFSRRLQQLNVPLSPLDTSRGVTSEILRIGDPGPGRHRFTAWLRRLLSSGDVLYAGAYSTCRVPNYDGECVKVVFPLPNGNAMVICVPWPMTTARFQLSPMANDSAIRDFISQSIPREVSAPVTSRRCASASPFTVRRKARSGPIMFSLCGRWFSYGCITGWCRSS